MLVFLMLIASAAVATAGVIQDLTVSLALAPCNCSYDTGFDGSPASGMADFTSIAPWTITFSAIDTLSWQQNGNSYFANFGPGGGVQMTGPDGLTFTGVVTSGAAGYFGFDSYVDVTFSGQWSDGLYGYGNTQLYFTGNPSGYYESDLNAFVAPEPSSLALMGGGLVGIWGCGKRFWSKIRKS
jgi:hypothetical protein